MFKLPALTISLLFTVVTTVIAQKDSLKCYEVYIMIGLNSNDTLLPNNFNQTLRIYTYRNMIMYQEFIHFSYTDNSHPDSNYTTILYNYLVRYKGAKTGMYYTEREGERVVDADSFFSHLSYVNNGDSLAEGFKDQIFTFDSVCISSNHDWLKKHYHYLNTANNTCDQIITLTYTKTGNTSPVSLLPAADTIPGMQLQEILFQMPNNKGIHEGKPYGPLYFISRLREVPVADEKKMLGYFEKFASRKQ